MESHYLYFMVETKGGSHHVYSYERLKVGRWPMIFIILYSEFIVLPATQMMMFWSNTMSYRLTRALVACTTSPTKQLTFCAITSCLGPQLSLIRTTTESYQ